jgi:hypothetical protein
MKRFAVSTLILCSLASASCNRKESVVPDDPRNTLLVPLGHSSEEKKKDAAREEAAKEKEIVDPNAHKGMNQ